jgi:hypothetical protein
MALDAAMDVQKAAISGETAICCLLLLKTRSGAQGDTENARARQPFRGATLSVSELIELANDFGFRAEHVRGDWLWLQSAVAKQPILLLLTNGNTIVSIGTGRTGAEEIVVCDPLHRGGIPIILSHDNIERAWSGNSLVIEPHFFAHERLKFNQTFEISEPSLRAYSEYWPADTRVSIVPHAPHIPTVPEACAMFADKLTSEERNQLTLIEKMLASRHREADQASDLPAGGDDAMLSGKRETSAELLRPQSQRVDSPKIIGLVVAFLLLALAGHASWGLPGLAVGLLMGVALVFSVMRLASIPANNSGVFDPLPPERTIAGHGFNKHQMPDISPKKSRPVRVKSMERWRMIRTASCNRDDAHQSR